MMAGSTDGAPIHMRYQITTTIPIRRTRISTPSLLSLLVQRYFSHEFPHSLLLYLISTGINNDEMDLLLLDSLKRQAGRVGWMDSLCCTERVGH
jgi:hypothetical protein